MSKILFIVSFIFIAHTKWPHQNDTIEMITKSIEAANTKEIAKYLNSSVILSILEDENVYSKTQSEMILKNFFIKYPPVQVKLKHTGSSPEGMQYAICVYKTSNATYRLFFYMKQSGNSSLINELRVEQEK
ncbi:DUF4783 domain-containing protein [Solitalea lacus]|uniref:DUF4783 domain-containing protein n=1 Tax=Solitalea lacus TaxID=2911172 RepID=UPI001EDAFDE4|nr:DUF4783 domain-containing protein [Solitalea lacus]UKJ06533.1 DUF4783 domain-containing protein [Solitalea lacus]